MCHNYAVTKFDPFVLFQNHQLLASNLLLHQIVAQSQPYYILF